MKKTPKNAYVNLALVVAVLFLAVCVWSLFIMPTLTTMLINLPDNIGSRDQITQAGRTVALILAYGIVADFMVADCLLMGILSNVKKGQVFTKQTVSLIKGVSWCCFGLGGLFGGLGIWFQLSIVVAFMALFLGLALGVVKNTVREAVAIKDENDLTV